MTTPTEADIHAYVDGRLDEAARQAVELYLARHPERAAEIEAWRKDAQLLRAAAGAWPDLPDNPSLDPRRVRAERNRRLQTRWAMAAMLVLSLGLGGLGGWQVHGWQTRAANPPMGDAMAAYRLVAADHAARLDIASDSGDVLQTWVNGHFDHPVRLPDLSGSGYRPVGGRLFVTDREVAAMVLYEDAQHHAISFYVRPPGPLHPRLAQGQRREGGLLAQYASDRAHTFALVSDGDDADRQVAARALESLI